MALSFFRKREPIEVPPDQAIATAQMAAPAAASDLPADNSAKDILDLLELELQAMMRQLERAAQSVASGAQSTAATLTTIRQRTDDLTGRTSSARSTADTFSQAADKFTESADGIGTQVRDASRLADQAASAAREASLNVDRLRESSAAIGNVVNLIASIAKQTTLLALNSTIEAARAGEAGKGFAVVASEVKALAVQTQNATEEIKRKIDALQQDAATSIDAVHRITQAIDAIRPVFETVNGAVAEQSATTGEMAQNAAATSNFIVSVVDSASEIDGVTKEAESHGDHVAKAGQTVAGLVDKLKSRCAILLRRTEADKARKQERAPCNMSLTIEARPAPIKASVYELSRTSMLVAEGDSAKLPVGQTLTAEIAGIGACKIRVTEHTELGAETEFVGLGAETLDMIEDKLFALHDENAEGIARAMEAGVTINKIFADAIAQGRIGIDDLFDTDYVQIENSDPPQFMSKFTLWVERDLTDVQEAVLAMDPRLKFCAVVDRNGYLAMNNKYCSLPQRKGDPAWNVTHARNRRFFNDAAGLAAARNTRTYFVQSYPRDMGNGVRIRMREIDVPIRVGGKHWGNFRTAYTL
ncbi:MAG: methyl-accepting chemotaxis protein [Proteobacteria bacterium]|nr:methyl-accepting chemotaxis protein [Pseudomonadota bacterium]